MMFLFLLTGPSRSATNSVPRKRSCTLPSTHAASARAVGSGNGFLQAGPWKENEIRKAGKG